MNVLCYRYQPIILPDQTMDIMIPAALKSLASGGTAARLISAWWKKSKGDNRALIGELKENLIYLDMVAVDHVPLADVIDKISVNEFKRLSREGFNYNQLKKSRIARYPSLQGSDLEHWQGKETEQLILSIYDTLD